MCLLVVRCIFVTYFVVFLLCCASFWLRWKLGFESWFFFWFTYTSTQKSRYSVVSFGLHMAAIVNLGWFSNLSLNCFSILIHIEIQEYLNSKDQWNNFAFFCLIRKKYKFSSWFEFAFWHKNIIGCMCHEAAANFSKSSF